MVKYKIVFTKRAEKDKRRIKEAGFEKKTRELLSLLMENPYQNPPAYEKLTGNLNGAFSRRINIQHRLVYQIHEQQKVVKILRMWTQYESV